MLHQTLPILGQLWQLFEESQILEFLRYIWTLSCCIVRLRIRLIAFIFLFIYPLFRLLVPKLASEFSQEMYS